MIFMLFAVGTLFFVGSLFSLRVGQQLGLLHRKRNSTDAIGALPRVESAIFRLMGLLLAFTISGGAATLR
jgi:hypothetical protein